MKCFDVERLSSPGLTSAGANLPDDLLADKVVAVHAEGKEHACAVGLTKMSTKEMKSINKGIGVENIHVSAMQYP